MQSRFRSHPHKTKIQDDCARHSFPVNANRFDGPDKDILDIAPFDRSKGQLFFINLIQTLRDVVRRLLSLDASGWRLELRIHSSGTTMLERLCLRVETRRLGSGGSGAGGTQNALSGTDALGLWQAQVQLGVTADAVANGGSTIVVRIPLVVEAVGCVHADGTVRGTFFDRGKVFTMATECLRCLLSCCNVVGVIHGAVEPAPLLLTLLRWDSMVRLECRWVSSLTHVRRSLLRRDPRAGRVVGWRILE